MRLYHSQTPLQCLTQTGKHQLLHDDLITLRMLLSEEEVAAFVLCFLKLASLSQASFHCPLRASVIWWRLLFNQLFQTLLLFFYCSTSIYLFVFHLFFSILNILFVVCVPVMEKPWEHNTVIQSHNCMLYWAIFTLQETLSNMSIYMESCFRTPYKFKSLILLAMFWSPPPEWDACLSILVSGQWLCLLFVAGQPAYSGFFSFPLWTETMLFASERG